MSIEKNILLTSMADVVYRFMRSYEYGGSIFEYLKDCGISEFDLYVEEEAVSFVPALFNSAKWMPDHIFGPVSSKASVKTIAIGKNYMDLIPIDMAEKQEQTKYMVIFCRWNYWTFKRISDLNYRNIALGSMASYSLYKNVILKSCGAYLKNKGIKCLFTKFPQANMIKNPSSFEKYLSSHSIYSFSEESVKYGLKKEEVIVGTEICGAKVNGVYRCVDQKSEHCNVVNGFRVTTGVPMNADKRIWCFGSSVVCGFFADDDHTMCSSLQRELNEYFGAGNRYSVVNVSNYSGTNVSAVEPLVKSLPMAEGDICIFNMDFPIELLEKHTEIIDLSSFFARPHNYGEIFVDINHMVGRGYCLQGKVLFNLLLEKGYFSEDRERTNVLIGGGKTSMS